MKKYLLTIMFCSGILAATSVSAQNKNYGAPIDEKGAISMTELEAKATGKEEVTAKVEGKVANVCQAKGCWMTIEKSDGTTMRVTFKDYGFFVPKDIAGKTVIINGKAQVNVTSIEELRHYAEDAKKSKEEIAQITEPLKELTFEADGVIIK